MDFHIKVGCEYVSARVALDLTACSSISQETYCKSLFWWKFLSNAQI